MNKPARAPRPLLAPLASLALFAAGAAPGCLPTSHAVEPSSLGAARGAEDFERAVAEPGPVTVETVIGADWAVPRSGLLNLDNPRAKAAQLTDGDEPIVVMFHALRHPTRGLFLVDTGVERALRDDPGHAALRGIAASVLHVEKMVIGTDTRTWLELQPAPPAGVFLTHLHADHVSGLRDVPPGTPVYAGPGEAGGRALQNLVIGPILDAALEGKGAIGEWRFAAGDAGPFEGIVDIFGDGTVWALWVPAHTPGSTAYLARTPSGPVLLVGDASHTAWGWQNGVEPGTYSADQPRSALSLARLRRFVARHPGIDVRLGHQRLAAATAR